MQGCEYAFTLMRIQIAFYNLQKSLIRIWIRDSECRIFASDFLKSFFTLFVQKSVHFSYEIQKDIF